MLPSFAVDPQEPFCDVCGERAVAVVTELCEAYARPDDVALECPHGHRWFPFYAVTFGEQPHPSALFLMATRHGDAWLVCRIVFWPEVIRMQL